MCLQLLRPSVRASALNPPPAVSRSKRESAESCPYPPRLQTGRRASPANSPCLVARPARGLGAEEETSREGERESLFSLSGPVSLPDWDPRSVAPLILWQCPEPSQAHIATPLVIRGPLPKPPTPGLSGSSLHTRLGSLSQAA